jgi:hypothetical protein
MSIIVRDLTGKNYSIKLPYDKDVPTPYTIIDLKKEIAKLTNQSMDKIKHIIQMGIIFKDTQDICNPIYFDKVFVFTQVPKSVSTSVTTSVTLVNEQITPGIPIIPVTPVTPVTPDTLVTPDIPITPNTPLQTSHTPTPADIARYLVNTSVALVINDPISLMHVLRAHPHMGTQSGLVSLQASLQQPEYVNNIMAEIKNILGRIPTIPAGLHIVDATNAPFSSMDNENDTDDESEPGVTDDEKSISSIPYNKSEMDKFTTVEQEEITNIVNMGFNVTNVIDMYKACEKNSDATIENLLKDDKM